MIFPILLKKEVEDLYTQENFKRLGEYFQSDALTRCRFEFLEVGLTATGVNQVLHHMNYVPKDIILMHNSSNATVAFDYLAFTDKFLYINASAPTTLRMLIGRHE